MKTKTKLQLVNVEELAAKSSRFEILPKEERDKIPVGHFAKVSDGFERFWVSVQSSRNGKYQGRIASPIISGMLTGKGCGLEMGDTIKFDSRHVYDIQPPQPLHS